MTSERESFQVVQLDRAPMGIASVSHRFALNPDRDLNCYKHSNTCGNVIFTSIKYNRISSAYKDILCSLLLILKPFIAVFDRISTAKG